MLQIAFVFALVGTAFFGSYAGMNAGHDYPSAFWLWLTHDAAGFFTLILCFVTFGLAVVTYRLYSATAALARDSKEASAKALAASTKATEILIDMERPYLGGGGDFENKTGKELYRLDIENHGKTPGFVVAYGLQFAKLEELKKEFPRARDVQRRSYIESLSPQGGRREIQTEIEKEGEMDIVFGCVWYEDIWGGKYSSRFILRIAATRDIPGHGLTRLSGIEGVSSDYWKWEYPMQNYAK